MSITGSNGAYISGNGYIKYTTNSGGGGASNGTTGAQFYLSVKSLSSVPTTDNTGTTALTNNGVTITQNDATRGKVMYFNGSSNYINTNYILPIIHTRSCWVKLTTTNSPNNLISTLQRPIWGGTTNYMVFSMFFNNGSGNIYNDTANIVSSGIWYYYALTYDGTTARLYKNGLLDMTVTTPTVTSTIGDNIVLGAWSSGNFLSGYLDNIRCYDTALTQAQIQAIYSYELANPTQFYYEK